MQYAKDNYGLDPGWRYCPACDTDFPSGTRFVNGLCPACARERELADAAEEELADAMENENRQEVRGWQCERVEGFRMTATNGTIFIEIGGEK